MTTLREAAEKALEALNAVSGKGKLCDAAIIALCAALAESEPEPVAWGMAREDGLVLDVICPEEHDSYEGAYTIPLYTKENLT